MDARQHLFAGLPVDTRRVELAGVSTAVHEGGDGPPIVLLHGVGEFAAVWNQVIADLVRTHRVVVPDLPGHGASAVTSSRLDRPAVMSWLGELIERTCDGRPPVLVGHLMGGAIAARFAAAHTGTLEHLVLVDTLGLAWYRPARRFAVPMMRFAARPTPKSRDRLFTQCFWDIDRVAELHGQQWELAMEYALDRARAPEGQAAMRKLLPRLAMPPIRAAELAAIDVPTTLIHGRSDLQVPLRRAEAASGKYGWPLHVIEDCRDDPAAEQPQAFLTALRSALTSTPRPSI